MDADFQARKEALLGECRIAPQVVDEVLSRLDSFLEPFVGLLARQEQARHARTFVRGLLSDLEHKNVESIAYLFDQERMPLQWFIGTSPWSDRPLRDELANQITDQLGDPDGVIVCDPSAFPKSGKCSVGVARQWCGRLGKVDNCQVGIYLGYVSRHEHGLVDFRLYLPREWTQSPDRLKEVGAPTGTKYHTRHELCLQMLDQHGPKLPHRWFAGDDELGRPFGFRRRLHERKEQYLLAVPSNTSIRDLEEEPPPHTGRGRPRERPWQTVSKWQATRPATDWVTIDVRDGSKGPLVVEALKRRVVARAGKGEAHEEVLVVIRLRHRDEPRVVQTDYYLSNASAETPLPEFGRVAKAAHRIEECLQRSKSEVGLGDYEVRTWEGWHHHQTLSLLAGWFLVTESRRGKKMDTGDHAATDPRHHLTALESGIRSQRATPHRRRQREATPTQRTGSPVPLEAA